MSDQTNTSLKSIVEGLIFAADEPITPKQLRDLVEGESSNGSGESSGLTPQKLQMLVNELNGEYEQAGKPFRIQSVAGGYIFATNRDVSGYVGKLHKEQSRKRLTQASLETLAIIAYKQPITKVELETIRGVNSDYIVKSLLERDFITIVGRQQSPGRPLLYGTTKRFLMHFGLNSVNELPKPREIEELIGETELEVEKRMMELEKQRQDEEEHTKQKRERKPHPISEGATAKIIPLKPDYRPLKKQEPDIAAEQKETEEQLPDQPVEDTQDEKPDTVPEVSESDLTGEIKKDESSREEKEEPAIEEKTTEGEKDQQTSGIDDNITREFDDVTEQIETEEQTSEQVSEVEETLNEEPVGEEGREAEETIESEREEEPVHETITPDEHQPVDETGQPERGWKKWKNKIVKIIKKIFG